MTPSAKKLRAEGVVADRNKTLEYEDDKGSPEEAEVRAVHRGFKKASLDSVLGKQYLNCHLDDWVSGMEQLLLRDLTLLKCIAECRWDVEASWLEYTGVRKALAETKENTTGQCDEDLDLELHIKGGEEDDNLFLIAPTTFHESADVLLMVMSFSSSYTFFSACSVSKRWPKVGGRMHEVRALAFDAAKGLRDSTLGLGFWPTAVAAAGATKKQMGSFLRCLKKERVVLPGSEATGVAGRVYYDGEHGGAVWPMATFDTDTKEIDSEPLEETFHVLNADQISVEEHFPDPTKEITFTLYLGRSPTFSSAGNVKGRTDAVTHSFADGLSNIPALTLKGVVIGGECACRRHLFGTDYTGDVAASTLAPVFSIPKNPVTVLQNAIKQHTATQASYERNRQAALRKTVEKDLWEMLKKEKGKKAEKPPFKDIDNEYRKRERVYQAAQPPPAPIPRSLAMQKGVLNVYGTFNNYVPGMRVANYTTALVLYQERWMLVHKTRKRWNDFVFSLPAPTIFSSTMHFLQQQTLATGKIESFTGGSDSPPPIEDAAGWEKNAKLSAARRLRQETVLDTVTRTQVTQKQLDVLKALQPAIFKPTKGKTADLSAHGW